MLGARRRTWYWWLNSHCQDLFRTFPVPARDDHRQMQVQGRDRTRPAASYRTSRSWILSLPSVICQEELDLFIIKCGRQQTHLSFFSQKQTSPKLFHRHHYYPVLYRVYKLTHTTTINYTSISTYAPALTN